jgi:hypothetical protein
MRMFVKRVCVPCSWASMYILISEKNNDYVITRWFSSHFFLFETAKRGVEVKHHDLHACACGE